jgi:hypothetical protein
MTWPWHDEDFLPTDNKSDSITNNEFDSLFNKSDNDTDNTDNTEILPNKSDSNTDNKGWLSNNKG